MPAPFSSSTLAELAARLEQRRDVSARLASSLQLDASRALQDVDLSDIFDDDAGGGAHDVDCARALQLAELAARTANAAGEALERLATGTYGMCEGCGQRIPLARLRAVPQTTACVDCKVAEGRLLDLAG